MAAPSLDLAIDILEKGYADIVSESKAIHDRAGVGIGFIVAVAPTLGIRFLTSFTELTETTRLVFILIGGAGLVAFAFALLLFLDTFVSTGVSAAPYDREQIVGEGDFTGQPLYAMASESAKLQRLAWLNEAIKQAGTQNKMHGSGVRSGILITVLGVAMLLVVQLSVLLITHGQE